MSEKAHHHLKEGRIITPSTESMCGIKPFKVGRLYLIAGRDAHIGLCNYVKEYSKMTIVERRGFAGGYKKGCPCKVSLDGRMSVSWKVTQDDSLPDRANVPSRRLPPESRSLQMEPIVNLWIGLRSVRPSQRHHNRRRNTHQMPLAPQSALQCLPQRPVPLNTGQSVDGASW